MIIKQMPFIYRVLDILFYPLMLVIAGLNKNDVQHTHLYHAQNFFNINIPSNLAIKTYGTDTSKFGNTGSFVKHWGIFHIPFFGGWKNYVVLQNLNYDSYWFIGWKTNKFTQVNRLPIKTQKIRVLTGQKGGQTYFFGIDKFGNFVKLKEVAQGALGDKKYGDAPLY